MMVVDRDVAERGVLTASRRRLWRWLTLLSALLTLQTTAYADAPSVIRIFNPGVGVGNRPVVGGTSAASAHLKGLLEEEFKKDGIQIKWTFLRGAGPAVNESYANGLVDFSLLGDLPSIVGRAGGLRTRVLLASGIRGGSYLVTPTGTNIQSIKDLRGRKVAIFKGTNIQLAAAKILEAHGLKESDIRAVNMDNATVRAALATGDVDAAFGNTDLLQLRDQGLVRVIFSTNGGDPRFLRHATFVGSEDFIKKYPEITKRVVKAVVLAAKWQSDHENDPAPVFQLWARSGVPFGNYKEDYKSKSLKIQSSPLIDPYLISQYNWNITEAKRFGLIKKTFKFEDWYEPRFLNEVLKELNLENYWKAFGADGKS